MLTKRVSGLKTITGRTFTSIRQTNEVNNGRWHFQSINTLPDLSIVARAISGGGETINTAVNGFVPGPVDPNQNLFSLNKKILINRATNEIKLNSASNTIIDCCVYYVTPRRDVNQVLDLNILTGMLGQQGDFSVSGSANAYISNPLCNIFNINQFTTNYNVYHSKKFKIHPGKEYNLKITNHKEWNFTQQRNGQAYKDLSKIIILRFNGQLINDSSAIPVTSYGSYMVNVSSTETYEWYEYPVQLRPLPILTAAPTITGTVNIINETSGLKTAVQDTITSTILSDGEFEKM